MWVSDCHTFSYEGWLSDLITRLFIEQRRLHRVCLLIWVKQSSPGLYIYFLWFFIHILWQQNTKLPKWITLALANTVNKWSNKMYFDCFPFSKYLHILEKCWYIGFFPIKICFLSFPHTLLAVKSRFLKECFQKYIRKIFSVLMVMYDKFKQIFKLIKVVIK